MPPTKQAITPQAISLKGSCDIVTEFFKYSVNYILFQRGVYPSDDFQMVKKYGQTVMATQDLALENYLERILKQVTKWLLTGSVTQIVLAIIATETRVTLERWVFDVTINEPTADGGNPRPSKPEAEFQSEIRRILKQIVASETYLPNFEGPTVFNILAYTNQSADIPAEEWVDTDPMAIEAGKSQQVKLRSFSTDHHRIEAMVAYRYEE